MIKILTWSGIFAAAFVLAAPCEAGGLPKRVISLAPSLTRQIHDLREQDVLVGVTSHCPDYAKGKEVVGSLTLLNLEKICSLKPDLILASTDSNRKNDIDKLKRLGMKVEVFEGCESFECMCREFVRLGCLLGKGQVAQAMVADIRSRLDSLRRKVSGRPKLRVFWQMGSSPLVTASDNTFTGEIIRTAGCVNVFGPLKMKYPRVNIESVVAKDPEIIFIVCDHEGGKSPASAWQSCREMSAVQSGRIHVMSADAVCQPTPGMFLKACEDVIARIHPGVL